MKFQTNGFSVFLAALMVFATSCKKDSSSDSDDKAQVLLIGENMIEVVGTKLEEAGYSEEQVETINTGALEGLETATALVAFGLAENAATKAATAVVSNALKALAEDDAAMADDDAKIDAASIIDGAVLSSLETLDDKLTAEQILGVPGAVASASVASFADAEIETTSFNSAVTELLGTVSASMDDAGLEDLEDFNAAANGMVSASLPALAALDVEEDELLDLLADVTDGTLSGFDDLEVTDPDDLETVTSSIIDNAIASTEGVLDFKDEELVQKGIGKLTQGATSALGAFQVAGVISLAKLSSVLGKVTTTAAATIKTFVARNAFQDYNSFASQFSKGVLVGFAKGGIASDDIADFQEDLTTAICLNADKKSTCTTAVESTVDDLSAEYEAACKTKGGTWTSGSSGYYCKAAATENATTITYSGAASVNGTALNAMTAIAGTATDADGIATVTMTIEYTSGSTSYFQFDGGNNYGASPVLKSLTMSGDVWSFTVDASSANAIFDINAVYTITITVKDNLGNEKTSKFEVTRI